MISDFFFIIKMLVLTVIVCLFLQLKISNKTVEQEFYSWIQNSVFVDQLQTVLDGGMIFAKSGYKEVHEVINGALNKMSRHEKRGDKTFGIKLKRYNEKVEDEADEQSSTGFKFVPTSRSQTQSAK